MELHEALAELARDHRAVFSDAAAFRGALDDYLDEGTASAGTINLLTDAVRLGALDQLQSMLGSGASPESAVASAGERLARDRGSRDTMGSQWACSVLGYALGGVPLELVTRLVPDAATQEPPPHGGATAVRPPPSSPPPPPPAPPTNPWGAPPAEKKSRTGLIIGIVAVVLVLVIGGGTVAAVALLSGDDEEPSAADDPTSQPATTATTSTEPATVQPTATEDTDLSDGLTVYGDGYVFDLPEGWQDGSDEVGSQPETAAIDTIALWDGDSIASARANLIVEAASSYGNDDPDAMAEDWKRAMVGSLEAVATTPVDQEDLPDRDLDGESAVGVEVSYENQYNADIRQLAYMTVHDGRQYGVTITIVNDDAETEPIYYDALDSWQWAE